MTKPRFAVSPVAQRDYRVLGGTRPSDANAAARAALASAHKLRQPDAVHVTPRKDGWAVKLEGRDRPAVVKPTKAQAVEVARQTARAQGARLIEHGTDGKIVKNTKPVTGQK
jgi:hypothetical protein